MALSNMSYDIVTALQSKLEAVEAYQTFIDDCRDAGDTECQNVFEQIMHDDEQHAERLRTELERLIKAGKFH